jgi:hypothetical protein
MLTLPHVQQRVDASTIAALLQQLVAAIASAADAICCCWEQHAVPASDLQDTTMELLCKLPAAAQLLADAVVQLLVQAVQQHLYEALRQLAIMAVRQRQLGREHLTVVLESSLSSLTDRESSSTGCMKMLLYLVDRMQLSSAALVQLHCC